MTLPKRNWMDMTWQDVAGAGADTARWIAVLPLAAVEQHGPHLPLGVDTYIAEAYLARVERILAPAELPVCVPAGAADRPVSASILSYPGHADALGRDRDRAPGPSSARAWRAPACKQAGAGDQPRRQCRRHGNRGARPAHAARHAGRSRWAGIASAIRTARSGPRRRGTASTPATSRPR